MISNKQTDILTKYLCFINFVENVGIYIIDDHI